MDQKSIDETMYLQRMLEQLRGKTAEEEEAKHLLDVFGSLNGVLEAGEHMLIKAGLAQQEAHMLALLPDLTRYIQRHAGGDHPKLNKLSTASDYCKSLFMGIHIEKFYVLCLSDSGRLLRCALLQQGTFDETPFYLDALLRQAIETRASALVLTHNHPAGSVYPSKADLHCTQSAQNALQAMGICLLDHIIVAAGKCVSLRYNGYMGNGYTP